MTKNVKRNCFEFSENITFQTDFCIWSRCDLVFISWILLQLVMQNFFATMLDDNVNKTRREKLVAAIVDCLIVEIFTIRCEFDRKWSIDSIIVSSWSAFAKSTSFLWNSMKDLHDLRYSFVCCIDSSSDRNVDDTMYFDWFSVNFIEREFSIAFLISTVSNSYNFSITCSCWSRHVIFWAEYSAMLLSKSSFDMLLTMYWYSNSLERFWYSDFWCFAMKTERSKSLQLFLDDWNIKYGKFISHECFDKLRRLFQSF